MLSSLVGASERLSKVFTRAHAPDSFTTPSRPAAGQTYASVDTREADVTPGTSFSMFDTAGEPTIEELEAQHEAILGRAAMEVLLDSLERLTPSSSLLPPAPRPAARAGAHTPVHTVRR